MEVTEPTGVEVVGWTADSSAFLYRIRAEQPPGDPVEGATIGVRLTTDGARTEYLLSLATDPGATPVLGTRLAALGVRPDPAPFHDASRTAVLRYGTSGALVVQGTPLERTWSWYAQEPWTELVVTAADCPRARVVARHAWAVDEGPETVRTFRAPDGRSAAVVASWGTSGEAPALVILARAQRTAEVVHRDLPPEVVERDLAVIRAGWDVVAVSRASQVRERHEVFGPPDAASARNHSATPLGMAWTASLRWLPGWVEYGTRPLDWRSPGCVVIALGTGEE